MNKVLDAEKKPETKETVIVQKNGSTHVNALLKQGQMALEEGEWDRADGFFEEMLNQDAENAKAYIGKMLAEHRCPGLKDLVQSRLQLSENAGLGKADIEMLEIPKNTAHIAKMEKLSVPRYLEAETIRNEYRTFDRTCPSSLNAKKSRGLMKNPGGTSTNSLARP